MKPRTYAKVKHVHDTAKGAGALDTPPARQ